MLWLLLAGLLVGMAAFWWWSSSAEESPNRSSTPTSVNPHARLNGRRLTSCRLMPARMWSSNSNSSTDGFLTLSYDAENGSWQLEFFAEGRQQILRYIAAEASFFYFQHRRTALGRGRPRAFERRDQGFSRYRGIFADRSSAQRFQPAGFRKRSQLICAQTPTVLCCRLAGSAMFLISEEVVIYVNKQNRKIDHIVSVNPLDLGRRHGDCQLHLRTGGHRAARQPEDDALFER